MTSYGYIIVVSSKISFDSNCIMLLKQFHNIATKAEKSATTFGDLPDCLISVCVRIYCRVLNHVITWTDKIMY